MTGSSILLYLPSLIIEYQSVCPLIGIGTPQPLSCKRVCPPSQEPKGGGVHTRLRVRGWGSPNSDGRRESLVLCLLCAVCTGPNPPPPSYPFSFIHVCCTYLWLMLCKTPWILTSPFHCQPGLKFIPRQVKLRYSTPYESSQRAGSYY